MSKNMVEFNDTVSSKTFRLVPNSFMKVVFDGSAN
jgi:hypothetical protein